MKKTAIVLLAAFFMLSFGLTVSVQTLFAQDTVKIGVPNSLTGRHAPFGQHMKRAFDLATEEINAAGGINGKKLVLVHEDDQSKPEISITVTQQLIQDPSILMLTGQYSSSDTYPAAALAEKAKMPFMISTAAADNITQSGWKYIFRMAQPATDFDTGIQDWLIKDIKPKSVVMIYENSLFGTSTAKAMKKWADDNKIAVPIFEAYDATSVDFKPLLLKLKAVNPDVVYAVSYLMDATLIARQMKEIDFNVKAFCGSAAGYSIPEFLTGAGDAGEYLYASTMWEKTVPYPGAKEFEDKYQKKYNMKPPYHAAQAYASAYVCADIIKRAKSLTREAITESMAQTDLMTIYGRVKFESYGGFTHQCKLPTLVLQVQKGKFEVVWPTSAATAKWIYPVPKWSDRKK
jgi:branched-chain amino acid transport system substrate-binding protein